MRYSSSLPLMGIGNPSPVGTSQSLSVFSLPLMGIGNTNCRADQAGTPGLITPHGDWKPALRMSSSVQAASSLPLMGIGNPSNSPKTVSPESSLPLMGIGNATWRSIWAWVRATHYPSWGLETVSKHQLSACHYVLITPHGDWKPVCTCPAGKTDVSLITPHGDWKRPNDVPTPAIAMPSLPLMGIGNAVPGRYRHRQCAAHYPSWGLETKYRVSPSVAMSGSLPLMGIGNPPAGLGARLHRQLITPHGDWKHLRQRPAREPARSHYPSWGLETTRPVMIPAQHIADSLPLMGIGNPSKNRARMSPRSLLITPHGDWKRSAF